MEMHESWPLIVGLGAVMGINPFAAAFALGLAGATGTVDLPGGLDALQKIWVIVLSGLLYGGEAILDKIPGADVVLNLIETVVRVPAASMAGYAVTGDLFGIMAGGVSGTTLHGSKTLLRIPMAGAPGLNIPVSFGEDAAVFYALWWMWQQGWFA